MEPENQKRAKESRSQNDPTSEMSLLESLDANAVRAGYSRGDDGILRTRDGFLSDGWVIVKNPAIVDTGALGPCCGIIVLDPNLGRTLVGHFAEPFGDGEYSVPKMLEAVQGRISTNDVRVIVGGIQRYSDLIDEGYPWDPEGTRAGVIAALEKFGFPKESIETHFSETDQGLALILDTTSGKLTKEVIG